MLVWLAFPFFDIFPFKLIWKNVGFLELSTIKQAMPSKKKKKKRVRKASLSQSLPKATHLQFPSEALDNLSLCFLFF
jgi:hypothetical protein